MDYNDRLIDTIDARIRTASKRDIVMGTAVTNPDWVTHSLMCTMDGDPLAIPAKTWGNLMITQGDRVGLIRFGSDWICVGTYRPQIFDTVAARDAAFPVPYEGLEAYCKDTKEHYWFRTDIPNILSGTPDRWVSKVPRRVALVNSHTVTDSVTFEPSLLSISVEANTFYIARGTLMYSSVEPGGPSANDMKMRWACPSGTEVSSLWNARLHLSTATTTTNAVYNQMNLITTTIVMATINGVSQSTPYEMRIITGDTPGDVTFEFAENTAVGGVTSVTLGTGTYMEIWKYS